MAVGTLACTAFRVLALTVWLMHTRGLTRNRNPILKTVFKGAALSVISQNDHPLRRDYERLVQNTKPPLARLTIARRIASATLAIWKKQEDYDPAKHCTADAK